MCRVISSHKGLSFGIIILIWLALIPNCIAAQDSGNIPSTPFGWQIIATLGGIDLSKPSTISYDITQYKEQAQFIGIKVIAKSGSKWVSDDKLPLKAKIMITAKIDDRTIAHQELSLDKWVIMPCGANMNERCLSYPLLAFHEEKKAGSKWQVILQVISGIEKLDDLSYEIVVMS
jgi:hypothetical protein